MLAAGADVNLAAVDGVTPLMTAAVNGQAGMARQLLDKGANVAALDRVQKNAMTYAAGTGHTEIVMLLMAKGVDPNALYNNDLTALMWAAGYGKTATVKALLAAGANPRLRDNRGKTAADIARRNISAKPRWCSMPLRDMGKSSVRCWLAPRRVARQHRSRSYLR